MNKEISNLQDAYSFALYLIKIEGLNLHPDDDFNDYIKYNTGDKFFSAKEAEIRNKLMERCFEVCEKENADIYNIMHDVLLQEKDLNKFNPSPEN